MKHFLIGLSMMLLAGCQLAGTTLGGAALGTVLPVIAQSVGISVTTLSDVAKAACATQTAANAASQISVGRGSTVWADRFSEVSKIAGLACVW